jgi:pyruvate kinase
MGKASSRSPGPRRSKILVTLGPATTSAETIAEVLLAGADAVRLNFSHGSFEEHADRLQKARQAAAQLGRPLGVVQDLQGPKVRLGLLEGGQATLGLGDNLALVPDEGRAAPVGRLPVQAAELLEALEPGVLVLLDEGQVRLRVASRRGSQVQAVVEAGGVIRDRTGVVAREIFVPMPALTPKDLTDLEAGFSLGVDFVALSYVSSAADLLALRARLREMGSQARVIAKLETRRALDNLPEILAACDAAMVARGDLGVHIPPEEVPLQQKVILRAAREARLPGITATQMLESMTRNPVPTRAEASDVFNAVQDGSAAVMLSGETSLGSYPAEAVRTMDRICRAAEAAGGPMSPLPENRPCAVAPAIARAACQLADDLEASALVVPTQSGATARQVAAHRPTVPVLAATPQAITARQLALDWGVWPLTVAPAATSEELLSATLRAAVAAGALSSGESVVVTGSARLGVSGATDLIRVLSVPAHCEQESQPCTRSSQR